ncbi:STN domain-containing protein [Xanthomonas campestris pv. campestris]|nr:STN domain-containing protein [Xanthomonas campestris pv. campestris]MCF8812446.1 STN domain-containing protein [Xanthomonas campestris pv. campestris]
MPMHISPSLRCALACLMLGLGACTTQPAGPQASTPPSGPCDMVAVPPNYDIPPARMDETMQQLAHATRCAIQFSPPTDRSFDAVPVNAVHGQVSIRQAVRQAIAGTGIVVQQETADSITLSR